MKIILTFILLFSSSSFSFDFEPYWKTYGLPCAATLGASALFSSKDNFYPNALLGCSVLVIGGELIGPTAVERRKNKAYESFDAQMAEVRKQLKEENEATITKMREEFQHELELGRIYASGHMGPVNVSSMTETQLQRLVENKVKNSPALQELEENMIIRIKSEVLAEYKARENQAIETVVDKVIKRVVAEPVLVPSRKKVKK